MNAISTNRAFRARDSFPSLDNMGRRALRKIDPQLDYSWHLLSPEDVPRPLTAEALFGRAMPLEVEVGSGKGLFLQNAALAMPGRGFFGSEVAGKYARFTAARLAKREINNARILHGDSWNLFGQCIEDDSLAAVHVYFPDPWWKKRHAKRRIMNPWFARQIQRTLTPGGRLHFWTDVKDYFDATLELLERETELRGPLDVREKPAEQHLDYRTHFERRTRLAGQEVYRAEFEK